MASKRRLNPDSIHHFVDPDAESAQEHALNVSAADYIKAKQEQVQQQEEEDALEDGERYMRNQMLRDHKKVRGNRWYDYVDNMADAVDFIKFAPKDIQLLLVQHINREFTRNKDNYKKQREHISSGTDKLRHIYYSQMHQRWQDQDPQLRRMFVLLTTFPEGFLVEFSERILMVQELCHNAEVNNRAIDFRQVEGYFKKPYRAFGPLNR
jgi:hypothetical protein